MANEDQLKDQAFIDWFATEWQQLLEAVEVLGLVGASWDRKAAWLVWAYGLKFPLAFEDYTLQGWHSVVYPEVNYAPMNVTIVLRIDYEPTNN